MISDVLFEAVVQIRWYQEHYPQCYADLAPELDAVCAAMAALQDKLDNPFGDEVWRILGLPGTLDEEE